MKRLITLLIMMLFLITFSWGQINYFTSFDGCAATTCSGWNISGGYSPNITSVSGSGYSPCNTSSAKSNIYSSSPTTTLLSQTSLGTSTGASATVSFIGKAIDYSTGTATPAGASTITAYWGTSSTGPWNTISSLSNLSSTTCQTYTFSQFTPTTGANVYIRFVAQWISGDFWMVFDDITLSQGAGSEPVLSTMPSSLTFGYVSFGSSSTEQSYLLSGDNLTAGPIVVNAPAAFGVSLTPGGPYSSTLNVTYTPPTLGGTMIYVQFTPLADATAYSGNITNIGGGASASVAVSGTSLLLYCAAGATTCDEYIGQVQIGTIDNATDCGLVGGYSDYTAISTYLYKNQGYPITVTNAVPYTGDQCTVWVDWNLDGDFGDSGETFTLTGGPAAFTGTITPPVSAVETSVRMRIRLNYTGTMDPCGTASYGEVEDYMVNVMPLPTTPVFSATPASKNYGDCPLNNFSPVFFTQTFTVSNIGVGTLVINSAGITGGDAADFLFTDGNTYPVSLPVGTTMQVSVKFSPLTVGTKSTTLRFIDSDLVNHDVALTGTGIVYPPQNLSGVTTPTWTNELDWDEPLPEGEIRYESGSVSNWYWVGDPTTTSQYFFNRMTPPANGTLDYIAILTREGDATTPNWEQILVCPESGTVPGTPDLTAPIATFNSVPVGSTTGELMILPITPAASLTTGVNFYIVTRWPAGSSTGPFVGTDGSVNSGRSYWSSDGGTTWNLFTMTWIMRGYMSTAKGAKYTLSSGDPNPSMAGLPVKTVHLGKDPMGPTHDKMALIPVPGVTKSGAGREVISYTVHRGPAADALTPLVTGIVPTDYIDAAVVPSTTYFYGVTAVYTGSQESQMSNVISLTTLAMCPAPTTPVTSNLSDVGATMAWTDPGSSTYYDLYIVTAGSPVPDAATIPTVEDNTANPYTWTGGVAETAYTWYVRADCGQDNTDVSTWTVGGTFTTTQVLATLPFLEDFEMWPNNWVVVNGTQTNQWYVGTATAHAGTQSAYISNDGGVQDTFDIVLASTVHFYRDIAFAGGPAGYTLKFWWKGNGEGCCDYMQVRLVDPSIVPVAGTLLTTGQLGVNYNMVGTWTEVTLTLPGTLTGSNMRLVVTWRNDTSLGTQPPAAIDDIELTAISCPTPTALGATPDVYSALLDWTENGSATLWDIEYGVAPYTFTGTASFSDVTKPYNLLSLLDGVNYQYKVRANCGGEYSNWSATYSFATLSSCPLPTALDALNVGPTSADMTWTSNGSGTTWNVELGLDGFAVGTGAAEFSFIETEENPLNAPGLAEATTYDFYVQEVCGFVNPKVDYFFMSMDENYILNPDPLFSGGTTQVVEPGETLEWVLYDQVSPSWYNIWFYNDPLDVNKMKKIRMGFYIQRLNTDLPASYDYVVNWSTDAYAGSGFPLPSEELFIERSEPHGQTELFETAQWVELYYTIPDYNPEWISIDIWGSNIIILNQESEPPVTSPLYPWWTANRGAGGIIVHECLPKPYGDVSGWAGPYSFTTTCNNLVAPYAESFDNWPPSCWDMTGGTFSWTQYSSGSVQCAKANFWLQSSGNTDVMTTYTVDVSGIVNPVLSFDWSHLYDEEYPDDSLKIMVSDDNGVTWDRMWFRTSTDFNSNDGVSSTSPGTFVPSGDIDLSTFGDLLLISFKGISDWGPDAFVDNVFIGEACLVNDWTGAVSTDWNDPDNWACGRVPSLLQDVEIPVGATNFPVIPAGVTARCNSIDVQPGATVIVQTGGTLTIVNP